MIHVNDILLQVAELLECMTRSGRNHNFATGVSIYAESMETGVSIIQRARPQIISMKHKRQYKTALWIALSTIYAASTVEETSTPTMLQS